MPEWGAILVAAGRGTRFGEDKVWRAVGGRPLWMLPLQRLLALPWLHQLVLVVHPERVDEARRSVGDQPRVQVVAGGAERQDSVARGMDALHTEVVLVHDAARPFLSGRVLEALRTAPHPMETVVVPVLPVPDTLRRRRGDMLEEGLDRTAWVRVQTPQRVPREAYQKAYRQADRVYTDESTLLREVLGLPTLTVPGWEGSFKLTYPEDWHRLMLWLSASTRTAVGYDRHRLVPGRPFVLGGVPLDAPVGPAGHSDGDVVLHALTDALLAGLGEGDIGTLFPDSDPRWAGMDSTHFVREALNRLVHRGGWVDRVQILILLEHPKIAPIRASVRQKVASLLSLPPERVSLQAKTGEQVGPVGRGEAVEAWVWVTLYVPEEAA